MRSMNICLQRKSYKIPLYNNYCYSTGPVVGINVKVYNLPDFSDLPSEYREKVASLCRNNRAVDLHLKTHLLKNAFEDTQDYWWEFMCEQAIKYGLGRPYAAGRSGGYLILPYYTESAIENTLRDVYYECKHCALSFEEHSNSKCIFDATWFSPYASYAAYGLLKLIRFIRIVERSLKTWVPIQYKQQLMDCIDWEWERHVEIQSLGTG